MLAVIAPPSALTVTVFNLRRAITGSQFRRVTDGSSAHQTSIECAGGLHTTASDIARWMKWRHLDRFAANDRDLRLLDHAAIYRDGLMAVPGLDDAGRWIPWVWAWVINLAVGNRPLMPR